MKFIGYNIVAIFLAMLAGYMVFADKPYWGWVVFAALCCTVLPDSTKNKDG